VRLKFPPFEGLRGVMAVTQTCDEEYSSSFQSGASFVLSGRCKMKADARDLLEVQKFDEIEETLGKWLRAVIRNLQEKPATSRRNQHAQPRPSRGKLCGVIH
jgi:hypothetical protein